MPKIHDTDEQYILDVLNDEEERLLAELGNELPGNYKYLFFRYVSLRDFMEKIKYKIA
ncbi:hypothetical protein [Clostridium sp. YIM B02555]|uniref:hypothetical protein n=1 Tax=Clostridium sp. YIM B02555 TaxID=2911968 RepID=UPI001EEDC7D7|nr:hypothetical protein [Clostridium sp. YIM B02555]